MESQQKVWENIASKWNKFRTKISPTVEKFLLEQSGKILDVGCGSGRNFMKVDGLSWHGIDFSTRMIDFAKIKAKKVGIDLDTKVSKTSSIPYEDNYFDSVICFALIHCIDSEEKREKTMQEIYRILKPGKQALISTWGPNGPRVKNKEKECYIPWTVKDKEEKQMRYTYIFDLDELVELCKKAGFEIVSSWEDRNVNVIVRKN